jgi:peptide-methionine (S)-S-oxide reductase
MFRVKDVTSAGNGTNKNLLLPRYKVSTGENQMTGTGDNSEKATFGAGCFWGVEAAFRKVKGVISTAVGYMGGSLKDPTYEQVCSGESGHAEVVQVTYDPAVVSFDELLMVFWSVHNPTQVNHQGPDIGSNYRSVIFYYTPEQGQIARKSMELMQDSGRFGFKKIVTRILPASGFWRAEEYHQQYFEKHGGHGACGI